MENTQSKMISSEDSVSDDTYEGTEYKWWMVERREKKPEEMPQKCCFYHPESCEADKNEHLRCEGPDNECLCGQEPCMFLKDPHCCVHGFLCICINIRENAVERRKLVERVKTETTDRTILSMIRMYWDLPCQQGWTYFVADACAELALIKESLPSKWHEMIDKIRANLIEYADVVERAHEYDITYYESFDEYLEDNRKDWLTALSQTVRHK